MGAAIGTTALNSAMTPAAVAEADPTMAEFVPMATAQCATASIITLFLCPFITAAFDKYMQKKQKIALQPLHNHSHSLRYNTIIVNKHLVNTCCFYKFLVVYCLSKGETGII